MLDGTWPADSDFKIHLEGHGTAELWVQGTGDLDPEVNLGALFPRGLKEGTINVPASASALIAVGATLESHELGLGRRALRSTCRISARIGDAPLDTIAYFSAGGPNALGALKPDIVAPGVFVAGAMAPSADPRRNDGVGLFASEGRCPGMEECFVVDDTHAITSGTSMSAPIVAGAIALLFERDPTLTSDAVRALLQAGARPLQGIVFDERQIGPGALDLEGALRVATAGDSPALRVPGAQSWLALSESYAHPDPSWPFIGYVELRDDDGNIADGFDAAAPPGRRAGHVQRAAHARRVWFLPLWPERADRHAAAASSRCRFCSTGKRSSRAKCRSRSTVGSPTTASRCAVGAASGFDAGARTEARVRAAWLFALGLARRRRRASHAREVNRARLAARTDPDPDRRDAPDRRRPG